MKTTLLNAALFMWIMLRLMPAKAETIVALKNGSWNDHHTWDLGRLPMAGDFILIPMGVEVKINENINFEKHGLSAEAIHLVLAGRLSFNPGGNLNLSEHSLVNVHSTGIISKRGEQQKKAAFLSIHLNKHWSSKQGSITGPLVLGEKGNPNQVLVKAELGSLQDTFVISWNIKQLQDAGFYQLSVSENGVNWEPIKRMKPLHSDSIEQMLCHVYVASKIKTDSKLYFKLEACDLDGQLELLTAMKIERKADRTKAWMTIPKMLVAWSAAMLIDGIIHHTGKG